MDREKNNQEIIYCADDDKYRINCDICDNLGIERFYKNHPKSGTHINNIQKTQRLNNSSCFEHNKCVY